MFMKQYLVPAVLAAVIFPLYVFVGNTAFSLDIGLLIGTVFALYFLDLISINSAAVIFAVVFVLYQYKGDDTFYLFGLLFGLFFCLVGLYAILEMIRPVKGKGLLIMLLAIVAPVALSLGGYLVWAGATQLDLWSLLGLKAHS